MNKCLETGNSYYCDLIERNPTTGTFFEGTGKIETPLLNISSQNIIGVDLNVLKTFSFGFGELKLSNYFSYLYKNDIQLSSTIAKEECSRTGVTQALYGTISDTEAQVNSLIGGNINLRPEKAITNSFSLVFFIQINLILN